MERSVLHQQSAFRATDPLAASRQAQEALRELFDPTPLQQNAYLSERYGAEIWLKREDLSPVRSYKLRGAFNFMRKSVLRHAGGFVCASAGNHAQGFAYACRHFGRKGTVFMPVTTPSQKIGKTRAFGGEFVEIELIGDIFDQCYSAAKDFAAHHDALMVPPFDHADIIEGQGSVMTEVLDQLPKGRTFDRLVLPVGGGGLTTGVLGVVKATGLEPLITLCEPEGAPSLKLSLEAGQRLKLPRIDGFVDGAAVAEIGELPFAALRHIDPTSVLTIPENRLCGTIIEMLNIEGIVLEPAGALSIDALGDLAGPDGKGLVGQTVLCVTSGGNFDFERLPEVKERALRFEGLKKYFIFRFPQRPGALRDFLHLLGPKDDIVRFEYLKKSARNFGSVVIGIETDQASNFPALIERFDDAGWEWQDITDNDLLANLLI
ncbi:threonine ammonia-lyase IlvA [Notoacmeibacter marinus]|uniref:threonine ammonia-lyase IlvA n=1 Tax=Notoacmeibacter marinus TaxID=1876515 RepID=UPI000DF19A65|nr:threonine ammonia-lyase IlvA [Notoacmeibacter marinus]